MTTDTRALRRARERGGRVAEMIAACLLMAKGYRVLAWRYRTRLGEIDLIVRRGRRLAFVEVKSRRSLADGHAALGDLQTRRLWDAAEHWVARHPACQTLEWGFDAVIVVGGLVPHHLPNVLQPHY